MDVAITRIAAAAPEGARQIMLLLPGAHQPGAAFVAHGLVAAAQRRQPRLEIWIGSAGMQDYLEGGVAARLHVPALAQAVREGARLWLAGVSLGARGAVEYAAAHPGTVAGMLLVAPFLATRGAIAEIGRAGGFARWRPTQAMMAEADISLLSWIKSTRLDAPGAPLIYAGYGLADRYAPTGRLLAQRLPPGRVVVADGDHDWPTWRNVWSRILAIAAI